jgi:hypothetical protein
MTKESTAVRHTEKSGVSISIVDAIDSKHQYAFTRIKILSQNIQYCGLKNTNVSRFQSSHFLLIRGYIKLSISTLV